MSNRARDLVNMAVAAGLDPGRPFLRHSSVCVDAVAPNGNKATFRILNNKSGGKDDQEALSAMRRFARQNPAPLPCPDQPTPTPAPKKRRTLTVRSHIEANARTTAEAPATMPNPAYERVAVAESSAMRELTPREIVRLSGWLTGTVDLANVANLEALSAAATSFLGQPVSVEAMGEVMDASEVAEPAHWAPPLDAQTVVLRELDALFKSLGHKPSPQFLRLLETLA